MKKSTNNPETIKFLYEKDLQEWISETIILLQEQKFDALDIEHLVEELIDLGKSEKNAVENFLEQIIRHLLLLQYWLIEAEYNATHWKGEIYTFRIQLKRKLTTNLRNYLELKLDAIYKDALGFVKIKTQNTLSFPTECPYSLAQLLDPEWLPVDNS